MKKTILVCFVSLLLPLFAINVAKAEVDLTITNPQLNSTVFEAGITISVNFTLDNSGTSNSVESYSGIYLSTDDQFDEQDIYLTSKYNEYLGGNQNTTISNQVLTIPSSTIVGTYYLIFYADYDKDIVETNEQNNTISLPINVVPSTPKDLTISLSSSSSIIEIGSGIDVGVTLNNLETGTVGPHYVSLYLSSNTIFDGADLNISAYAYIAGLAGNGSIGPINIIGELPNNVTPGEYYIFAVADSKYTIAETNENNNTSFITITVIANGGNIDLEVSDLVIPSTVEAGIVSNFNYLAENNGTSRSNAFTNKAYLSTDNVLDGSDIEIASIDNNYGLYGGYSYTNSASFNIPNGTPGGNYFFIFKTDVLNTNTETNETNNTTFMAITVTIPIKDITVFNPSVTPSSVEQGNTVNLSYTLKNIGLGTVNPLYTSVFLSTNATFNESDQYLSNYYISLPNPNTDYNQTQIFTIPSSTSPGNYYLIIYTDRSNNHAETNENNNIISIPIIVTASLGLFDLTIPSANINSSPTMAGSFISVGYQYRNLGPSACINPSNTELYFSNDNTLSLDDLKMGTNTNLAIGNNVTYYNVFYSIQIPLSTVPGNYFMLVKVDGTNDLAETNETNNIFVLPIEVLSPPNIDLFLTDLSIPTTQIPGGDSLEVTITVNNVGTLSAQSNYLAAFLINDLNEEYYVDAFIVPTLAANSSVTYTDYKFHFPTNIPVGNYVLFFKIDPTGYISENNESNNTVSISVEMLASDADLTVTAISLSSDTVNAGDEIQTNFTINNSGSVASDYFESVIYISRKSFYDNTAIKITEDNYNFETFTILAGSSEDYTNMSLFIPFSLRTGDYYILYFADVENYVAENVENNNVNYIPIHVNEVPNPDLILTNVVTTPLTIEIGESLYINYKVKNIGLMDMEDIPYSIVGYISEDTIIDEYEDQFSLSNQLYDYLVIGESSSLKEGYCLVNSSVTTGNNYLILKINYYNEQPEMNIENNFVYIPLTIIETGTGITDLTIIDAIGAPELFTAGGYNDIEYTFQNNGSIHYTSASLTIYYSEDDVLTAADQLIQDTDIYNVYVGNSKRYNYCTLPSNANLGTRYLFLVVDEDEQIAESNETNNIYRYTIQVVDPTTVDLKIKDASILTQEKLTPDHSFAINFTLVNTGVETISSMTTTGVYFSLDNILDGSDILLSDTIQQNDLYPGNFIDYINYPITLPNGLGYENYYILIKADIANIYSEYDEVNNVAIIPLNLAGTIRALSNNSIIEVYPNPTTNYINLKVSNFVYDGSLFKLYNSMGIMVLETELSSQNNIINLLGLNPGVYSYSISNSGEKGKVILVEE